MKKIENIYILKGSMAESEALKEIERIKEYFEGTTILNDEFGGFQGLKKLSYEIKGEKTGYFYITNFIATEQDILNIERKLRINDNIIKFITIRKN